MRLIVSYDVETITPEGRGRLRKVARVCKSFGVRVQYSIFECSVGAREIVELRARLLEVIATSTDSLRIWHLGEDDAKKTEHHGVRRPLDPDGPLIV
jgi:CRISPR-associated protein Cas2